MSVRILITGSREFTDRPLAAAALSQVRREHPGEQLVVIDGMARGADALLVSIVEDAPDGWAVIEPHPVTPAMWRPDGPNGRVDKAADHKRNQRMVDSGADVCLAFLCAWAANNGTKGCMKAAARAGIEVRKFTQSTPDNGAS